MPLTQILDETAEEHVHNCLTLRATYHWVLLDKRKLNSEMPHKIELHTLIKDGNATDKLGKRSIARVVQCMAYRAWRTAH